MVNAVTIIDRADFVLSHNHKEKWPITWSPYRRLSIATGRAVLLWLCCSRFSTAVSSAVVGHHRADDPVVGSTVRISPSAEAARIVTRMMTALSYHSHLAELSTLFSLDSTQFTFLAVFRGRDTVSFDRFDGR